jgi:hypothetical protein
MGAFRILLLSIFAAALAGCAATTPLLPAPENVSTTTDEPDRPLTAEVEVEVEATGTTEAATPKPPAPKPAAASKAAPKSAKNTKSAKGTKSATTPEVGSAQWKEERAEDARKEQHIKEVIEGICTGC